MNDQFYWDRLERIVGMLKLLTLAARQDTLVRGNCESTPKPKTSKWSRRSLRSRSLEDFFIRLDDDKSVAVKFHLD